MLEYKQWLILSEELNDIAQERSDFLHIKYGEVMSIPENIRLGDEYRKDNASFQKAFSKLRKFNQVSPKSYLKKKSKDKRGY